MNATVNNSIVKVLFSSINGNSFVAINNYLSSAGEVSNRVIQVGVNRTKRLEKDLVKLQNYDISEVVEKFGKVVAEKAHLELIISLQKVLATEVEKDVLRAQNDATINRSDAQIDMYTVIEKGMKVHNESKDLYVYGYTQSKEVLVPGVYKEVKSQAKTLAKNAIKYGAKLQDNDYRLFKAGNLAEIKLQGVTVPF